MRTVDIRAAVGGRLGVAVRDGRGRVLLAAGSPLTAGLCEALVRRGHAHVVLMDGVADDVLPQDALATQTRETATTTIRDCFGRLQQGENLPVRAVTAAMDAVLSDLHSVPAAALELAVLRTASDRGFVHSVNVCVYALLTGQAMGLHGVELRALGMGALLHDIGKVLCPDLCHREGPFSEEELRRLRQHPLDGFEMLRQHQDLHLFVAHIAYQHHERMDGSGYPRGLRGNRILALARVTSVANAYDARTGDGSPQSRLAAVEHLRRGAGHIFDADAVHALLRRLAVYPAGTPVLLADGTVAVVIDQGMDAGTPTVRLLGRAGRRFREQVHIPAAGPQAIAQVLPQWPAWLQGSVPPRPE